MSQGLQTQAKPVQKTTAKRAQEKRLPPEMSRPFAGECSACRREKGVLQRTSYGSAANKVPPIVHEVLRSSGQPLDMRMRARMEPLFGRDFSNVRVHTNAIAAQSSREINARAYTVGNHITFGAGQYSPHAETGNRLIAHELAHTIQQHLNGSSRLMVADSLKHENEADAAADAIHLRKPIPTFTLLSPGVVSRQKPEIENEPSKHEFEYTVRFPWSTGLAEKEKEKCEEFPGGSTDCEVDKRTGTPTGKVTHRIDEKNSCTRPCVEQHEAVHVKQMKTFCPKLRDCYLSADKGKRPDTECIKMAIFGMKERECEAYRVSVPCVERRLKNARECQSKENKEYGTRKLASEKCFQETNCGS